MKILHWYHDLMNLYGDYGNLEVLKKHLEDQGMDVFIEKKTLGEDLDLSSYDMIYIGSGTERKQELARKDILSHREELQAYIEKGGLVLTTGNAMELFGKTIGENEALGFLPFTVRLTKDRYTGDVILENDTLGKVVGFINKCSLIEGGEEHALFRYAFRDSNLKDNDYEGFRYKNLFGTHVIGPVLVKNPSFMKEVISVLLQKYGKTYREMSYPYEEDSYSVTLEALLERMRK